MFRSNLKKTSLLTMGVEQKILESEKIILYNELRQSFDLDIKILRKSLNFAKQKKLQLNFQELFQREQNIDEYSGLKQRTMKTSLLQQFAPNEIQTLANSKFQRSQQDSIYDDEIFKKQRLFSLKQRKSTLLQNNLDQLDLSQSSIISYFYDRLQQMIKENVKIEYSKLYILICYIKSQFGQCFTYRQFYNAFKDKIKDFEWNVNIQVLYNCENLLPGQLVKYLVLLIEDNNKQKFAQNMKKFNQIFKELDSITSFVINYYMMIKYIMVFNQKKQGYQLLIQSINKLKQYTIKYKLFFIWDLYCIKLIIKTFYLAYSFFRNKQTSFQIIKFLFNLIILNESLQKAPLQSEYLLNVQIKQKYQKRSSLLFIIIQCLSFFDEIQVNSKEISQKLNELNVLIISYDGPWSVFFPQFQSLLQKYSYLQASSYLSTEQWQSLFKKNKQQQQQEENLRLELLNLMNQKQIEKKKSKSNKKNLFQLSAVQTFAMMKEENKCKFLRIVQCYKQIRKDKKDKVYMGTNILITQELIRLKEVQRSQETLREVIELLKQNLKEYQGFDYCSEDQFSIFMECAQMIYNQAINSRPRFEKIKFLFDLSLLFKQVYNGQEYEELLVFPLKSHLQKEQQQRRTDIDQFLSSYSQRFCKSKISVELMHSLIHKLVSTCHSNGCWTILYPLYKQLISQYRSLQGSNQEKQWQMMLNESFKRQQQEEIVRKELQNWNKEPKTKKMKIKMMDI